MSTRLMNLFYSDNIDREFKKKNFKCIVDNEFEENQLYIIIFCIYNGKGVHKITISKHRAQFFKIRFIFIFQNFAFFELEELLT